MKLPELHMPSLGSLAKYLGLLTLGKGIVDKVVIQQLLEGAAKIIGATVVVAILTGALIITALAGIYYALINVFPIQEWAAVLIVSALVAILIGVLVYKISKGLKKLAMASTMVMQPVSPISPVSGISDIVNAFVNGLKDKEHSHEDEERPVNSSKSRKSSKYPKSVN